MSKVTGLLEKAYQNDKGYWSINVNDTWYGTYTDDYSSLEGMSVEFEATKRGNYWNAKNVKAVPGSAKPAKAGGATPAAEDRQKSIVLQSSYKTAAEVVGALIKGEAISLGAKNKAFDAALGLVDEVALRIYNNCIDPSKFVDDEPAPGPDGDDNWEQDDA